MDRWTILLDVGISRTMARNRNKGFGTGISRPFWNRDHLGLYRKIPAYAGQKELIYGTLETLVVAFFPDLRCHSSSLSRSFLRHVKSVIQ